MNEPQEDWADDALAEDFAALGNPHRLRLLRRLVQPLYSDEMAEMLGMSRQAARKHVDKLVERGFLRALHGRRPTGPVLEYQIVPPRLFALATVLSDLGGLQPSGGPLVKHVERTIALDRPGGLAGDGDSGDATRAHLLVLDGPEAGKRVPLLGSRRLTIGRDEDRDLRLTHDPYVSSRHAELQPGPLGYDLVDVYSANGTFVNFTRLPKGGRVCLRPGDALRVGRTFLVFQDA